MKLKLIDKIKDSQRSSVNPEEGFHDKIAINLGSPLPTPKRILRRYGKHRYASIFIKECAFKCMGDLRGLRVLDLGCGAGENSVILAKLGAKVTAIDISPRMIQIARRRALLDDVSDSIDFLCSPFEVAVFSKKQFDICFSYGSIHHMNPRMAFDKIYNILNSDGKLVLVEPINLAPAFNAMIAGFTRRMTMLSPNERPLGKDDLASAYGRYHTENAHYYNLIGRFSRLLPSRKAVDYGHLWEKVIIALINTLDFILISLFPSLCRYSRVIVLTLKKNLASYLGGSI